MIVGYPGPPRPVGRTARRPRPPDRLQPARLALRHVRQRPWALQARAACRPGRSRRSTGAAFRAADLVVADTDAQAELFRSLGAGRVEMCFVGAEERLFTAGVEAPPDGFTALFVGKLIPLHGLETILTAARLAPEHPLPGGRLGPARPPARRPAAERRARVRGSSTSCSRASCTAPRARSGSSAPSEKAAAGDPEQGLPGARLRHAASITADTPAARELLRDGESALLVPPGDPRRWPRRSAGSPRSARPCRPGDSPPTGSTRARTCSARVGVSLVQSLL